MKKYVHNIYFNYFFMIMGLTHPSLGFSILEFIDYDHNSLYSLLKHIEEEFTFPNKKK